MLPEVSNRLAAHHKGAGKYLNVVTGKARKPVLVILVLLIYNPIFRVKSKF
jgi:hypothetical protein